MKVAILAGGLGTRLGEETSIKPKPMVEIGNRPILWHIMKHYEAYNFNEFVLALGYKGEVIKKYIIDFAPLSSNLTVEMHKGKITKHENNRSPKWTINLIDTGLHTQTGGRLKRLRPFLREGTFMLTYGDGISDINLHKLLDFHRRHGKLATLTAVRPPARFGHLELDGNQVCEFSEKPQTSEGWVNGAFFVLEPEVLDYIDDDMTPWEKAPLERLAAEGQLMAYKHEGFWQCMDTLRDKHLLQSMWDSGNPPWKSWQEEDGKDNEDTDYRSSRIYWNSAHAHACQTRS